MNSQSEMFIPTSVWDQSQDNKYGIFEVLEASILLEMMKDIFTSKVGMQSQYIVEPFNYKMQLSFRNNYNQNSDLYKYKFDINIDKIIMEPL